MFKRNSPQKNKASTGCVKETPQIRKRRSQHGMCKRNSPHKYKASMGCVRETAQIKMKPALAVLEKLPR